MAYWFNNVSRSLRFISYIYKIDEKRNKIETTKDAPRDYWLSIDDFFIGRIYFKRYRIW